MWVMVVMVVMWVMWVVFVECTRFLFRDQQSVR